jgi:hypothetical protein
LIVRVHQDSSITLEDPDTFTAFSLSAPGLEAAQIAAAFGPDAEARDEEHVWISIARLRALGRAYGSPRWQTGCDGMIGYATSKGWVDQERRLVRAHIER